MAIIGQNGAGKTTFAKLMNGLLKPTKGKVLVSSMDSNSYSAAQLSKVVGYSFQNPDDQIFHNTVYNEIAFGPKNLGVSKKELEIRVQKAAALAGISDYLMDNPYDLPFAQRKFVTIASVLAMDSAALILDEPTAGQDLAGLKILKEMIKALVEQKKAVIVITHDMEFVAENFERTIVMAKGRIIKDAGKRKTFWDKKTLEKAYLLQPYVADLAAELGLGPLILAEELIAAIGEKRKKALE